MRRLPKNLQSLLVQDLHQTISRSVLQPQRTVDGDSAYQMNILLYPVQNLSLIEETRVQVAVILDFLAGKKTMDPNSVVERDNKHVIASSSDQTATVCVGFCISIQSTALSPNVDRMTLCFINRGENVKKKTILILIWVVCG
jgi:hypothetical protein